MILKVLGYIIGTYTDYDSYNHIIQWYDYNGDISEFKETSHLSFDLIDGTFSTWDDDGECVNSYSVKEIFDKYGIWN